MEIQLGDSISNCRNDIQLLEFDAANLSLNLNRGSAYMVMVISVRIKSSSGHANATQIKDSFRKTNRLDGENNGTEGFADVRMKKDVLGSSM